MPNEFLNKKAHIEKLVLSARTGDKTSFLHLRMMYDPLCDQIYENACSHWEFLSMSKFNVYHGFYIGFWKAIETYKFGTSFSLHLSESLVRGLMAGLKNQFGIPESQLLNRADFFDGIKREKVRAERLVALQVLKRLTVKQKMVFLHLFYLRIHYSRVPALVNSNWRNLNVRIRQAKNRIKTRLTKVKVPNIKNDIRREKIYKIVEKKII